MNESFFYDDYLTERHRVVALQWDQFDTLCLVREDDRPVVVDLYVDEHFPETVELSNQDVSVWIISGKPGLVRRFDIAPGADLVIFDGLIPEKSSMVPDDPTMVIIGERIRFFAANKTRVDKVDTKEFIRQFI